MLANIFWCLRRFLLTFFVLSLAVIPIAFAGAVYTWMFGLAGWYGSNLVIFSAIVTSPVSIAALYVGASYKENSSEAERAVLQAKFDAGRKARKLKERAKRQDSGTQVPRQVGFKGED